MPPPGYEPFLRAICANPDDDTVRLVYADWLDENAAALKPRAKAAAVGRAEFIRCQIRQSQLTDRPPVWVDCPRLPSDPERCREWEALDKRSTKLFERFWFTWASELPKWEQDADGLPMWYERGFPYRLSLEGSVLTKHLDEPWDFCPLHRLTVLDLGPVQARKLARSPLLARFAELEFGGWHDGSSFDSRIIEIVLNSPHLRDLRAVHLLYPDAATLAAVADADGSPNLQMIACQGCEGAQSLARGLRRIRRSKNLPALRAFYLTSYTLTDADIVEMEALVAQTKVDELSLDTGLSAAHQGRLARSPHFAKLRVLDLRGNRITPAKEAVLRKRFGEALRM
jgi:uncharacterized protein (TIGR02996 family)